MVFHHYVVIDGARYFVPDDGGIDTVRQELLDAVRSGAAYVALGREGAGYTEVLVTPVTPIHIEHINPAAPLLVDDSDRADMPDIDWWL